MLGCSLKHSHLFRMNPKQLGNWLWRIFPSWKPTVVAETGLIDKGVMT